MLRFGISPACCCLSGSRGRRRDDRAVAIEQNYGAGFANGQTGEKLRQPLELNDNRDDSGKIAIDHDRCRGRNRRPVAIREVREHAPPRAVLRDGAWYQVCAVASKLLGVISRPRNSMSPGWGV